MGWGAPGAPLVGRREELDRLDGSLRRSTAGQPCGVLLRGDAGIGKSTLVRHVLARARSAEVRVLSGGCVDLVQGRLPYGPFVAALRPVVEGLRGADWDDVGEHTQRELARLFPRLGIAPPHGTPQGDRSLLFEAIRDLLRLLAERSPVVLVLEDLHWSDASTRDLISFIIQRFEQERVLLLCTYRTAHLDDDDAAQLWTEMLVGNSRSVELIELRPLAPDDARVHVMQLIDGGEAALINEILERSEGNPFFAEEIVAARRAGLKELPPSIRELMLARIRALEPGAREVVKVIAVAGRSLAHRVLADVLKDDPVEATSGARAAMASHVLVVDGDGYAFRHSLLRECVYGELLPGERSHLHARFAEAVEGSGMASRKDRYAILAHHWDAAGYPDRALHHALGAATEAERSLAFGEALHHHEHALDLLARSSSVRDVSLPRLLYDAALAAQRAGEAGRAVAHLERALTAPEEADDPVLAPLIRSLLSNILSWELCDLGSGVALAEEALALIREQPPSAPRAKVLADSAGKFAVMGDVRRALDVSREAVETAVQVGARKEESWALTALGVAHIAEGELDSAIEALQRAAKVAQDLGDGYLWGQAIGNLGYAMFLGGASEEAAELLVSHIEPVRRAGGAGEVWFLACNAAECLIPLGRWLEAEELVLPYRDSGTPAERALSSLLVAEVQVEKGDLRAAIMNAEIASSLTRDDRGWSARVQLIRGTVALWERRTEDARKHFEEGLSHSEGFDRTMEVRLLWGLARALADVAIRARARGRREVEQEAIAAANQMIPLIEGIGSTTRSPTARGYCYTARAEILRGSDPGSPQGWAALTQVWDELGFVAMAAYARLRLGEESLAAKRRRDARADLSAARARAAALMAAPLLLEIEGVARRARLTLDAPAAVVLDSPVEVVLDGEEAPHEALGLSGREIEVLRLVAGGLTNRQIADALYISPKTASAHVSAILMKLGVAGRVDAARIAYELGLLEVARGP